MMLNAVFFCSLWASIFAGSSIGSVPLVPRAGSNITNITIPAAVQSVCEGGLSATVKTPQVFANDTTMTVVEGSCPPASNTSAGTACQAAVNETIVDCSSRFTNEWPLFSQSGYVAKCGAKCNTFYGPDGDGPDPNDCQNIIDSLKNQETNLFTLSSGGWAMWSSQTCAIVIQNQIASPPHGCNATMIYDLLDVGYVAEYLAWNSLGTKGSKCIGDTDIYHRGVKDFYIKLFANRVPANGTLTNGTLWP